MSGSNQSDEEAGARPDDPPAWLLKQLYSVREAAVLARIHPSTARSWVVGQLRFERVLEEYQEPEGQPLLSFLDLIELFAIGRCREQRISLQKLRKIRQRLSELLDTQYPFSHSRLWICEGSAALFRNPQELVRESFLSFHDTGLEDVRTGQLMFAPFLAPHVEELSFTELGLAHRWSIRRGVIVDPRLCFGQPVVEKRVVSTSVLARSYLANEKDEKTVAALFRTTPGAVLDAFEFECDYGRCQAA